MIEWYDASLSHDIVYKVPLNVVENWRSEHNDPPYEETSAIHGTNIDQTFTMIAQYLL